MMNYGRRGGPIRAVLIAMNDREKALCATADIEKIMREYGLPYVCIILMPDEGGCCRSANGMSGERAAGNRRYMSLVHLAYMQKLEEGIVTSPNGE